MADLEGALLLLRSAADELARVEGAREAAMRVRDEALRAARDAGATYQAMQEAGRVSNVTVTKALRRQA